MHADHVLPSQVQAWEPRRGDRPRVAQADEHTIQAKLLRVFRWSAKMYVASHPRRTRVLAATGS